MFATRRHLAAASTSGFTKIVDYSRTVAAGRESVYRATYSKSGSIYRMVKLLFATRRHLAAASTSGFTKIVDYSRTVAAGREMSTDH
jgi:flagellar basal body rod protein FlgF